MAYRNTKDSAFVTIGNNPVANAGASWLLKIFKTINIATNTNANLNDNIIGKKLIPNPKIAVIDGSKKITLAHAAEALQYRGYENT